jgi:hypothetical protein
MQEYCQRIRTTCVYEHLAFQATALCSLGDLAHACQAQASPMRLDFNGGEGLQTSVESSREPIE